MSAPALEGWFSSVIRRNRKSFALAILALVAVLLGAYLAVRFFSKTDAGDTLWTLAFLAPGVICSYFLTAQRLRDMNITGWLALLWIPIGAVGQPLSTWLSVAAFLVLFTVPGTRGTNRYGPDPLGRENESDRTSGQTRDEANAGASQTLFEARDGQWWERLGVSPYSSEEEVRSAYRKLIRQYHPDGFQSAAPEIAKYAEEQSALLNDAYREALASRKGAPGATC